MGGREGEGGEKGRERRGKGKGEKEGGEGKEKGKEKGREGPLTVFWTNPTLAVIRANDNAFAWRRHSRM